jgi:fucose permease
MAHVNDAVGEGEFVAASGGLLIMQGVGAAAGPLLAGFAMSASEHGLAYMLINFSSNNHFFASVGEASRERFLVITSRPSLNNRIGS